ncbi:MAG: hypothetical protein V4735_03155 [Pseudomonadota bacterium]
MSDEKPASYAAGVKPSTGPRRHCASYVMETEGKVRRVNFVKHSDDLERWRALASVPDHAQATPSWPLDAIDHEICTTLFSPKPWSLRVGTGTPMRIRRFPFIDVGFKDERQAEQRMENALLRLGLQDATFDISNKLVSVWMPETSYLKQHDALESFAAALATAPSQGQQR